MTDEELLRKLYYDKSSGWGGFVEDSPEYKKALSRLARGRSAIKAMERIVETLGTPNTSNRDCIAKICEIIIEWEADRTK